MANPTNIVWVGIGPGNACTFPISAKQVTTPAGVVGAIDLTKIVLVSYNVYLPDPNAPGFWLDAPVSWSGVIVSATPPNGLQPSTLQTQHNFGTPTDCPRAGNYKVVPQLTDNLGTLYKCASRMLVVVTEQQL